LTPERRGQPKPAADGKHGVAKSVYRIEAIVLDKQLHELLAASKRAGREIEAAQGLITRRRIELIITVVAKEARPYASQPDRLRVALNLCDREVLRQIEYADSLEVVAHINDEVQRKPLLDLKVYCVAISTKILFAEPSSKQRDQRGKVRSKR